jgi:hypothetical protein
MGNITIKKNKLILETNSLERTEKAKKLLIKYLGNNIEFQKTLIESTEQKLKSLPEEKDFKNTENELTELPEVQEKLEQLACEHWKKWFNEPIPALNNKTPRQAASTKKGRERLEALLLQYESNNANKSVEMNIFKADLNYLRKELNLQVEHE